MQDDFLPFAEMTFCSFSPVGFNGNLSLLDILFVSRGLKQMEVFWGVFGHTCKMGI